VPGSALLFLVATATGAPAFTPELSSTGWAVVAFLGIGAAVISYMLWLWALRNTTPTLVAVALPMNPLMALLLGGLLLGEEVNIEMIGGFVLVLLGIVIANWRRRRRVVATGGDA
jgi:drug/metabolite transporter (DMT)-like permease